MPLAGTKQNNNASFQMQKASLLIDCGICCHKQSQIATIAFRKNFTQLIHNHVSSALHPHGGWRVESTWKVEGEVTLRICNLKAAFILNRSYLGFADFTPP